jgi:type II secretory pathway pseudopilin PulG
MIEIGSIIKEMKFLRNNKKGFSLIELLAILIILGTVFAFIIPRFIDFDSNAKAQEENYENKAMERHDVYDKYLDDWIDQDNRKDFVDVERKE